MNQGLTVSEIIPKPFHSSEISRYPFTLVKNSALARFLAEGCYVKSFRHELGQWKGFF